MAAREINMTEGSLTKSIVAFSLPLIATNILQLLYNAADVVVVGKFVGTEALAAVGSTTALINLLLNLFIGLSVGVSVSASHNYGSKNLKRLDRVVHTAVTLSIIMGICACILGEIAAEPMLEIMQTPEDVIDGATLYMKIYFIGVPAVIVYNFCSAIMRSVGDTRRPLYILAASGMVNVILNLVFVIVFKMGISGVATATTVSNYISAVFVVLCLMADNPSFKLELKKMRLHMKESLAIIRVGIPAGIQGMTFSFSNIIIQSAINSFGSQVMAGSTAAANIEGFVYMSMNAVYQAALTATSQNFGAGNKKRIYSSLYISAAVVTAVGIILGGAAYLFRVPLLGLYTNSSQVIECGAIRVTLLCLPYFICGLMEVEVGFLRGVGYSLIPTLMSLIGVCGIRLVWIYTVFASYRSQTVLYSSWAISWVATAILHGIMIITLARKRIDMHMRDLNLS